MPEWIHNRAMHILAKNPEMGKSQAFAIATQQGHATGHTPKDFGTAKGKREAKAKYDEPKKSYDQKSDPGQVGKKLERAEDKGAVKIKQSGLVGNLVSGVVVPHQQEQVQELRKEIEQLKASLPKHKTKKASLMLESPLDSIVIGAFSDELQKIAAGAELPGSPTGLSDIKSTIPTQPLSGKTPKYSKVNADPHPSPMAGKQPLLDAPPARA